MFGIAMELLEVLVRESLRLPNARTRGRRASWTNDAEGGEIPEVALNLTLLAEAFLQLVASGLGALALVWATVVLLGGFSTMLVRTDFWFITAIVFIETARIVGYNSGPEARFFVDALSNFSHKNFTRVRSLIDFVRVLSKGPTLISLAPIFAAAACVLLSIMRILPIVRHSYGEPNSNSSNGNMKPALLLFYVLVLTQGALFILWFAIAVCRSSLTAELNYQYFVKKEGRQLIDRYCVGTVDRCMEKGVASTMNTTLVSFAEELLQSEVTADHACAVSVLYAVITRKERTPGVVQQIRASEQFVGRLFKILSSEESPFNQEIKSHTAEIVEKLSSNLCLADFPGAANCILSLLDAHSTKTAADPDNNNHLSSPIDIPLMSRVASMVVSAICRCSKKISTLASGNNDQQSITVIRNDEHPNTSNEKENKPLIIHGLLILAKLAKNPENATEIYSTKGLFSRITAPISNKLYIVFRDDSTATEITEKSLQVLSKLVSGANETNEKIRQEICSSGLKQNTIQPILTDDSRYNMLKVPAIKIFTKLILTDSSRNGSAIVDFINVLLGFFFDDANDSILRKTAGNALAMLAMDSNIYCEMVLKGNAGTEHSVVQKLTDMLTHSSNKLYRTAIAKLLMQFCANLPSEEARNHLPPVKTILHEVLKSICSVGPETSTYQSEPPQNWLCHAAVRFLVPPACPGTLSPADRRDQSGRGMNRVQNQRRLQSQAAPSWFNRLLPGACNPDRAIRDIPPVPIEPGRRKTLVAFLGLAVQMCDKLLDASDLYAAVGRISLSEAELVDKLTEIIEMCNKGSVALLKGKGPCADCLEIIKSATKLCAWMMTKTDYVAYFQEKNIARKLEDALEAMRGLEMTVLLSYRADKIANYETLASIVKHAQGCIPPQPDDHINDDDEGRCSCSCFCVGV